MYQSVSRASKILKYYKTKPVSGPRVITPEIQKSLDEADTLKKRGKKGDKLKKGKDGPYSQALTPKKHKGTCANPSAPKKQKLKKMAMTPPSSPSDSDYATSNTEVVEKSDNEDSQIDDSIHGHSPLSTPNQSVNLDAKIPSPTHSPTHTTTPVTIAPCLPPVSTQPPTCISQQNLIFLNLLLPPLQPDLMLMPMNLMQGQRHQLRRFPITQKDLEALNAKLDTILASSTTSSSQAYSEAVVKGMLATLVKEHDANLVKAKKVVEDSAHSCLQATEKVDKLISDTKAFIIDINTAVAKNAPNVNDAIVNLNASLRKECESIEKLQADISADNSAFQTCISSSLSKFQEDLDVESKFMVELALRATQLKTQEIKLKHAQKEIDELKYERTVKKSCVSDVNSLLSNLVEACDPILAITIRWHLADKLCPAIALLNRLESVLEAPVPPEHGEIARDLELNENARIAREDEEKELKGKEDDDTLECRKLLFPMWTLERMMHEVVDLPSVHWLEPVASFDLDNTKDSQFDMPFTRRAFMFHYFDTIAEVSSPDIKVDKALIDFYLAFGILQYLTWSAQKITTVKVIGPIAIVGFMNVKFKVTRGSENSLH
ncbi:unnamed protein product [Lactuca saligna]|uniref:Uncharacterized protein n=1 Tax=Lactuca saligna TaxID=75948 RepID=A0AA35ZT26_LACSI|nr:unnamed protein product [Lactuca saligna]